MERYQSSKIAVRVHFSTLKTALKLNKKCKTRKNANILETAGNMEKFSKFQL